MNPRVITQKPEKRKYLSQPHSRTVRHGGYTANRRHVPLKSGLPIKRIMFVLILMCMAFISLIWLQLQIDTISRQIKDLEQKNNDLESINHYMRLQLDKATTYEKIYPIVKEKFGMDLQSSAPVILEVPDEILSQKYKPSPSK